MAGKRRKLSALIPTQRGRRNMSAEGAGASSAPETVHINSLPDDVLSSILSRLTAKERVGVESVSPRWRKISRQYAWRSQIHLDITDSLLDYVMTPIRPSLSHAANKKIVERRFKCLFDRWFSHLRSVRTRIGMWRGRAVTGTTIVNLICTARNLVKLELGWIPLTVRSASLIARRLPRLESLSLIGCLEKLTSSNAEQALMAIMEGCRLLKKLDLSQNEKLTGERFFAHLPSTLQSLNITWCVALHQSAAEHLSSACVNGQLRMLDVSGLPIGGPVLRMGRLFEELPLLEKLAYGFVDRSSYVAMSQQETAAAMAKISSIKRLKSLHLRSNRLITVEVSASLCLVDAAQDITVEKVCALEIQALEAIVSGCTELTSLAFDYTEELSVDKLLEVVAGSQLRVKLTLSFVYFHNDSTIRCILGRCGALRELDISHCHGITRASVLAIGEFVAWIAQSPTTTNTERSFYLACDGSSIDVRPGELETELLAAHPVLKCVRQRDSQHGERSKPSSLEIRW